MSSSDDCLESPRLATGYIKFVDAKTTPEAWQSYVKKIGVNRKKSGILNVQIEINASAVYP